MTLWNRCCPAYMPPRGYTRPLSPQVVGFRCGPHQRRNGTHCIASVCSADPALHAARTDAEHDVSFGVPVWVKSCQLKPSFATIAAWHAAMFFDHACDPRGMASAPTGLGQIAIAMQRRRDTACLQARWDWALVMHLIDHTARARHRESRPVPHRRRRAQISRG
jgi:hypothetical protein